MDRYRRSSDAANILSSADAARPRHALKQIAPGMTRAAVLRDPAIASGIGQFGAVQAVAPSLGVELSPVDVRDAPEIERAVTALARSGIGGLIDNVQNLSHFQD